MIIVASPSNAEACHTESRGPLAVAIASVYLQDKSCILQSQKGVMETDHIDASTVRPAKRKRSPSTLNNLPCDEVAPIALCRFFPFGVGKLVCLYGEIGKP